MGRRLGYGGKKIIGSGFALAGAFILVDVLPVEIWWLLLGFGLIVAGWLLFNT